MLARLGLLARLAAGPLALVAFFLPWANGEGLFRYESYSGFDLMRLTTTLGQLDPAPGHGVGLFAAKCLLLAVPVAAVWRTLLAPAYSWHWCYRAAGVYLVVEGLGVAAVALVASGGSDLTPGLAMMFCSSVAVLLSSLPFNPHAVAGRLPSIAALVARTERDATQLIRLR